MKKLTLRVTNGKVAAMPAPIAVEEKRCRTCGQWKPKDSHNFRRHKHGGGWKPDCKLCIFIAFDKRKRARDLEKGHEAENA